MSFLKGFIKESGTMDTIGKGIRTATTMGKRYGKQALRWSEKNPKKAMGITGAAGLGAGYALGGNKEQ